MKVAGGGRSGAKSKVQGSEVTKQKIIPACTGWFPVPQKPLKTKGTAELNNEKWRRNGSRRNWESGTTKYTKNTKGSGRLTSDLCFLHPDPGLLTSQSCPVAALWPR